MYSIYKTFNKITEKFYIGKQYKNYAHYLGSGKLLRKAIDKHGKQNFTKVILEDKLTSKQASEREQYWIDKTGALGNQGYNMNEGGTGGDNSKHIDYKGWYVSKVNSSKETYVQNIAEWCDKHGIDKSMPTGLNNPNSRLFQKQTKGWRIRRSDMPKLKPYVNNQHKSTVNIGKGKTWRLKDGKRVWITV